jgi:hypothetical protein
MIFDLSDLPALAGPVTDLVKAIREAKSSSGPGGKRLTRQEVGAIVVAVGKLVVAIGEELAE